MGLHAFFEARFKVPCLFWHDWVSHGEHPIAVWPAFVFTLRLTTWMHVYQTLYKYIVVVSYILRDDDQMDSIPQEK